MKTEFLVASHLLVMAGAWLVSDMQGGEGEEERDAKLSERVLRGKGGGVFGADFLASEEKGLSKYESLKGSLEEVDDYRAVVGDLIKKLPRSYLRANAGSSERGKWDEIPSPTSDDIAEFEVRVREWLSVDREDCFKLLRFEQGIGFMGRHPVFERAFADYALEEGAEDWVFEKAGGLGKVYETRWAEMGTEDFLEKYGRDFKKGGPALARVFGEFDFKNRELVLESFRQGEGGWEDALKGFLGNEEHDDGEVVAWIGELEERFKNEPEFWEKSGKVFQKWIENNAEAPLRERFAMADHLNPMKLQLPHFVGTSVAATLDDGRDWRYEFRHERVEAGEVLENLVGKFSASDPEEVTAIRTSLFYELVNQDSIRAMDLLAPLPDWRRKEIMVGALNRSFHYEDPELAKSYFDSLPEPVDEAEKETRKKVWAGQIWRSLSRYGEGVLDWVAAMPEGDFREESIEALFLNEGHLSDDMQRRIREEFGDE